MKNITLPTTFVNHAKTALIACLLGAFGMFLFIQPRHQKEVAVVTNDDNFATSQRNKYDAERTGQIRLLQATLKEHHIAEPTFDNVKFWNTMWQNDVRNATGTTYGREIAAMGPRKYANLTDEDRNIMVMRDVNNGERFGNQNTVARR